MSQGKTVFILRRNSGQGGAEKAAERLASQLSAYYCVERMWAGQGFKGSKIAGVKGPAWWRSWRYTQFIDRLQLKQNNQLVLSLEYGPNCDIYRAGDGVHRLNVLRRYGKKKGWMINPWHWFAPRQERKCLESSKVIVANSKLVEGLIKSEYPHLSYKTTTIYNGFNPDIYRPSSEDQPLIRRELGLPEHGVMLLLSGHGFLRKGLHHAVKILDMLVNQKKRDVYLVVAGKGDSSYVESQINQAGLKQRVLFAGTVTQIQRYYQAANFMVLLTRHDPFSNSCLEALACGCPIVTSDQNGAAEVLNERNGLVVSSNFSDSDLCNACDFIEAFSGPPEAVSATVAELTQAYEVKAYLRIIEQLFEQQDDLRLS